MASFICKTILSLVLVAHLVVLDQFVSTITLFPKKYDEKKVIECREKLATVEGLDSGLEFLELIKRCLGTEYMSKADVGECLEISTDDTKKIEDILYFIRLSAFESGLQRMCDDRHVDRLLALHKDLANKLGLLSPWWERIVKQITVYCKLNLIETLQDIEKHDELPTFALTTLVNLAQNFNWQDPAHFVMDGPVITTNMTDKKIDDIVGLVQTSGRIEEISRLEGIKKVAPRKTKELAKQEFNLTREQRIHLTDVRYLCGYFDKVKSKIFNPLVKLEQLGYDYSALGLDQQIASYPHIHIWLASSQTCDIFKLVQAYLLSKNPSDGSIRLRLRPGSKFNPTGIDEMQHIVFKKFHKDLNLKRGGPFLKTFSPDLDLIKLKPGSWEDRLKLAKDERRQISEAIFNGKVLKKLADFFTSI